MNISARSGPKAKSGKTVFFAVLVSSFVVQTAWILALPAFRGIDEFDHVYRADAVAHGHITHEGVTSKGRGHLVEARASVVDAASDMCASYAYTGPANCSPVDRRSSRTVTVASAAATYNPVYYALVGTLAKPFQGANFDFAMRFVTAFLCALLLAWAAVVTASWSRTAWPLVAFAVAGTPMLIYSTAIASPNGLGYAGAALLWASGVGFVRDPQRARIWAFAIAAMVLIVTHTTGIIWLTLISAVVLIMQPRIAWFTFARRHIGRIAPASGAVTLVALASVTWVLTFDTNALNKVDDSLPPLSATAMVRAQLLWTLQTIAAFPVRNEAAPASVYVLWLFPFATMLIVAARRASMRTRLAGGLLLSFWLLVPALLTLASYRSEGLAWQGRYALPLAIGFTVLAGVTLDQNSLPPRRVVLATAAVILGAAHGISVGAVALAESSKELSTSILFGAANGPYLVGIAAALAATVPLLLTNVARYSPADVMVARPPSSLVRSRT